MKKTKGAKAALLLTAVSLTAAGCGNGSSEPSKQAANTEENETSPVTFTFFGGDANPNWTGMNDETGKAIVEKTGVTIDGEFAISGTDQQKIALMIASGEYPEILYPKGETSKLVEAGALVDLTDLIDKYAPNIKKLYGPYMNRLRYSKDDPAIYTIPTNTAVDNTAFDAGGGFELQLAVLEELGYPEIRTTEDFEKALKEYYAKHPTIDGQPTIPLLLNADDWKIMITVTNPAVYATGGPDDGEFHIDPDTYEAKLHYKRPEEKEYFRWLNHMYNEGLLDKETFTQKNDQYLSKIASGRVLGLIDQDWDYAEAENSLKAAGKYERTYGHFPVTLSEEYKDHSFVDIGNASGYGISFTTAMSEEKQIRAMKFLDWMASDEGQVLVNWGIEGKHYKIENGKRTIPADVLERKNNDNTNFQKETGIGLYTPFTVRYGDGVKDSTDNYYTTNYPEQITANYSEPMKKALKAYDATTWKDLFPGKEDFPVKAWGAAYNLPSPGGPDFTVPYQKSQDIVRKAIPAAIVAPTDRFDAIYDQMLNDLEGSGIPQMEALYTQLIKDTVDAWGGADAK
ncbi:ABC transporter substrate-binding protein [Saccharibacillus sp. CPCC 101409]|uniref:ABC transporter substrate-binding protein n=1 Tax=Saccharibacillus sp. CPCC 101409 TaxID=3058041 RepID=UPI0026730399|nr:ABC transporter substrate-binding protein [Saccharibacillus sp. CPCC 101409]MDO3413341.1 ABC transporter substrate-binding protein [Saccharibacillus sp. CPCC 101409]